MKIIIKRKKQGKRVFAALCIAALFAVTGVGQTSLTVRAAETAQPAVTPTTGVLYTGAGAEIFTKPDPSTLAAVFPGDVPVQVTGMTSNGYFQIVWQDTLYYVYGQALSATTGTQAYKLTYVDAKAALVGDMNSGALIYAQGAMDRVAPASTTKIMTALLTLEAVAQGKLALDTPFMVTPTAVAGIPGDASHVSPQLQAGEVLNVLQLLECVMVKSDCQACNVLAEAVAGDVNTFVVMMNARAVQLGCVDTNFVNTSGYPADNHYTNAYSLFLIMREAMKYPAFQTIINLPAVTIAPTNLSPERTFASTDLLLLPGEYYNPYVIGGKTGTAKSSGACFVAAATREGKSVISVVMGAGTRQMSDGSVKRQQFSETNKLLEIGLAK